MVIVRVNNILLYSICFCFFFKWNNKKKSDRLNDLIGIFFYLHERNQKLSLGNIVNISMSYLDETFNTNIQLFIFTPFEFCVSTVKTKQKKRGLVMILSHTKYLYIQIMYLLTNLSTNQFNWFPILFFENILFVFIEFYENFRDVIKFYFISSLGNIITEFLGIANNDLLFTYSL